MPVSANGKSKKVKKGYLVMFLHSCAHFLHMSAHCLHISILSPIFSHSIAHASHMSAHMLHTCFVYSLPLHIIMDAILHTSTVPAHHQSPSHHSGHLGIGSLSCICTNRPHRPSCIRCSFRCSQIGCFFNISCSVIVHHRYFATNFIRILIKI